MGAFTAAFSDGGTETNQSKKMRIPVLYHCPFPKPKEKLRHSLKKDPIYFWNGPGIDNGAGKVKGGTAKLSESSQCWYWK